MKVEVAVLGSPSPIVLVVSVDVKQHCTKLNLGTPVWLSGTEYLLSKVVVYGQSDYDFAGHS